MQARKNVGPLANNAPVKEENILEHVVLLLDNLKADGASNALYWLYQLCRDADSATSWQTVRDELQGLCNAYHDLHKGA